MAANMQSKFRFVKFCVLALISLAFLSTAASNGDVYSWETVQLNMRMRSGDYQTRISNEDECKTRCVETSSCIGVDWHDGHVSCFLLSDSTASPYSANGFRHWRLARNRSTLIVNQASPAATTPIGIDLPTSVNPRADKLVTTQESNTDNESKTDADGIYAWQPVQLDMRMKMGEFRQDLQNETACKDYCYQTSSCVGVAWLNRKNNCILHTDCSAKLDHDNGFRYWSIKKYIPAPFTCQNLIRRVSADEVSVKCDPQNSTTAANALGVLLSLSTAVIIALLLNTWRLNRRIQKLAFPRIGVQFVQQVPEQHEHESDNYICPNQQAAVYMEMIGTPSDHDNIYDDLNDIPVQYTTLIL